MKTKLMVLMLIAIGTIAFIGTGADFASYDAQRNFTVAVVADDQEFIDLTPGQYYAYITSDGVMTIDLSTNNPNYQNESLNPGWWGLGVSPDTHYNFDNVFYVSNGLWDNVSIDVQIVVSGTHIALYTPDEWYGHVNSSTSSTEIYFTVDPGEQVGVGLDINTTGMSAPDSVSGSLTINAWPST
jgi:hypothetical protein